MSEFKIGKKYQLEVLHHLLQSSLRSIPFNIALATLLIIDLLHNKVPKALVFTWYSAIVTIGVIRWLYSQYKLKYKPDQKNAQNELIQFTALTFVMGMMWGSSYFIFFSYASHMQELVLLLVLAGMSAGAMASLSVFLPAYYAYVLPIFMPLVLFNVYLLHVDRIVMAAMFFLFIVMLFMTAQLNSKLFLENIQLAGEKDWLIKKLSNSNMELENANEKLIQSIDEIRVMSITDPLTGLFNRRHFNTALQIELDRAKRNGHFLCLLAIDIDNFKYINDTFGHPYGDEFLTNVSNILKKSLKRGNDTIYRLGGDEFAAILVNISTAEAKLLCEELKNRFLQEIEDTKVSLSMGMVSVSPESENKAEEVVFQADRALYEAKNQGKNKMVLFLSS